MKNIFLAASAVMLTIVLSCNGGGISKQKNMPRDKPPAEELEQNKSFKGFYDNADTSKSSQHQIPTASQPANADWDKKIIKTANVNVEVKNYESFSESVKEKIRKFGGWIAEEQQNQNDYKIEDVITIKIPVDQFDNLVNELTTGDGKIFERKISSEDVTTAVVDTKSRLEAKKQVRLRYLDLLKQARNMEEILNVQHEINGIQEDIEAASGRIEYLSHASVFSTINLTYFQVLNATAKDSDKISFGTKLWQAFTNGWEWIGDVFVGIISIWPLLLGGFLCWVAYRRLKPNKLSKTKTDQPAN